MAYGSGLFLADFRALADRWTGQKFLKFIRDRREFDAVEVWLLADHWQLPQEQGSSSAARRAFSSVSPRWCKPACWGSGQSAMPAELTRLARQHRDGGRRSLDGSRQPGLQTVCRRFGRSFVDHAISGSHGKPRQGDRHFYVSDLSSRLMNPGRQSEFLIALKQAGLIE